jgi:predicted secreted hydrolase
MRLARLALTIAALLPGLLPQAAGAAGSPASGWQMALPGWVYAFPRDHAAHPDFKTEWWYFTGNLRDDAGHAYGYELTFFREGVLPPGSTWRQATAPGEPRSRFVQNDFKFAHFAISDLSGRSFHFTQKMSRGAFGDAGFGSAPAAGGARDWRLAWIDNWTLTAQADGAWRITARAEKPTPMSIDLRVTSAKPPVIEGPDGVSRKAAGVGNASHYYSFTRLATTGTLALGAGAPAHPVHGQSWFDHEWASNQLAAGQVGWDWFCCQFDDQTELMLYAMRRRDGSIDPASSGTWIDANGTPAYLRRAEFSLRPLRTWRSPETGATYPIEWQVDIPGRRLALTIAPRLDDQELALRDLSYWEGATRITGTREGRPLNGVGYMELTGYAGALKGLQADPR